MQMQMIIIYVYVYIHICIYIYMHNIYRYIISILFLHMSVFTGHLSCTFGVHICIALAHLLSYREVHRGMDTDSWHHQQSRKLAWYGRPKSKSSPLEVKYSVHTPIWNDVSHDQIVMVNGMA